MLPALEAARRRHPDRLAVADGVVALSFDALVREAERVASSLGPGQVVVSRLPSGPAATALQLAARLAGAVIAPIDPRAIGPETRDTLLRLDPDVVVSASASCLALELARPDALRIVAGAGAPGAVPYEASWPRPSAGPRTWARGVAWVQPTSGSTGRPKLVLISADALDAAVEASRGFTEPMAGRTSYVAVPQSHAMGGAAVLERLAVGASVHTERGFVPGAELARLAEAGVRDVAASPTWARLVLRSGPLPGLQSLELGAAATDAGLVEQLRAGAPDATLAIRYGLTEAVGALCRLVLPPHAAWPGPGVVGAPLPGVELRGVDGGAELAFRGPQVALGVLEPDGTRRPLVDADGFLATGDEGAVDEGGLVRLSGRRSSFIKTGGHRVAPAEVEAVLRSLDGVLDAVVVGVPDPTLGERVAALVELAEPPPERAALVRALAGRLEPSKRPRPLLVVDAIPRAAAGKPDLRAVRARLAGA